jgi:hypothetical protein
MSINYTGGRVLLNEAQGRYDLFADWVRKTLGVTTISDFDLPRFNKGLPLKDDPIKRRIDAHLASADPDLKFLKTEYEIYKQRYRSENGVAPSPLAVKKNHEVIRSRIQRRRAKTQIGDT